MPVIAQDAASGEVLMFAWMNREALEKTAAIGQAVYWSRSRRKLWHKGEESGHFQKVLEIRTDCDNDVVLLKIEQVGGIACHTGRKSCFFQKLDELVPLESRSGLRPVVAGGKLDFEHDGEDACVNAVTRSSVLV